MQHSDHLALMAWVRQRALILQTENLAMVTKRTLTAQMNKLGSVSSLIPEPDEPSAQQGDTDTEKHDDLNNAPAWVKHLIAAVQTPPAPSFQRQTSSSTRST